MASERWYVSKLTEKDREIETLIAEKAQLRLVINDYLSQLREYEAKHFKLGIELEMLKSNNKDVDLEVSP